MSASRWWMIAVVVGAMAWGESAVAQMGMYNPLPETGTSGYTARTMYNIYRQDIGDNYSVGRIIKNNYSNTQARVPYVGQAGVDSGMVGNEVNPSSLTGVPTASNFAGRPSKPFAAHRPSSTVSPWMNMFRDDLSGNGDLNYQTLVQPQLQQQQINRQLERQNLALGQRVQAVSAQSAYQPQGSTQIYPTGHPTAFMNYMHYYPTPRGR